MLRTWLVRISPEIGNPSGRTTLDAKGRTEVVIGHTMANRDGRQNKAGETIKAGRRPLCSRPVLGFKSIQTRSPASNPFPPSLNRFAALVLSPIERCREVVVA